MLTLMLMPPQEPSEGLSCLFRGSGGEECCWEMPSQRSGWIEFRTVCVIYEAAFYVCLCYVLSRHYLVF